MNELEQIEQQLSVTFPPGYRAWQQRGYCDLSRDDTYLWFWEAEWIPLAEIPGYDLWRVTAPGLTPFAFTGGGDHWCFSTAYPTGSGEYEIWYCLHDEELGERFAPSFPGWLYRQSLTYASGGMDRDARSIQQARRNLQLWSEKLAEIHPGRWSDHLSKIAESEPFEYHHPKLRADVTMFGFLTAMERDAIIREQFGERYLDQQVEWGKFPE